MSISPLGRSSARNAAGRRCRALCRRSHGAVGRCQAPISQVTSQVKLEVTPVTSVIIVIVEGFLRCCRQDRAAPRDRRWHPSRRPRDGDNMILPEVLEGGLRGWSGTGCGVWFDLKLVRVRSAAGNFECRICTNRNLIGYGVTRSAKGQSRYQIRFSE